jgi:hypothetical protein
MPIFISKKLEVIFLHNPKTGGRAIRDHLKNFNFEGPFYAKLPEDYSGNFKFCFVRNPYDRLVSAWRHCMKKESWKNLKKEISLEDFFETISSENSVDLWINSYFNTLKNELISYSTLHALPQSDDFYMLDKADFIGRFENIQKDFDKVCKILNIKQTNLQCIKKYQTDHLHYKEYFKDESFLQKVNNFYEQDFAKFNYKKL